MIEFVPGELNESRLATELLISMEFTPHSSLMYSSTRSLSNAKVNLLRSEEEGLFFTPRAQNLLTQVAYDKRFEDL